MEVSFKECPLQWGHVTRSPHVDGAVKSLDEKSDHLKVAIPIIIMKGSVAMAYLSVYLLGAPLLARSALS